MQTNRKARESFCKLRHKQSGNGWLTIPTFASSTRLLESESYALKTALQDRSGLAALYKKESFHDFIEDSGLMLADEIIRRNHGTINFLAEGVCRFCNSPPSATPVLFYNKSRRRTQHLSKNAWKWFVSPDLKKKCEWPVAFEYRKLCFRTRVQTAQLSPGVLEHRN